MESIIDEEIIRSVWSSLGMYIQRQLRGGRAVNVPKLGIFNFSHPEFKLEGATNPDVRDK